MRRAGRAARVRQHIDADPERLQLRHALEYFGRHADLVQAERQRQPPDAAACDQYRHGTPLVTSFRSSHGSALLGNRESRAPGVGYGRRHGPPLISGGPHEETKMLKLYYAPGTCALASHIALEEAGSGYTAERIDFKANQQNSAEYLAINPKGRVPALVTDRGVLTETPAISPSSRKVSQVRSWRRLRMPLVSRRRRPSTAICVPRFMWRIPTRGAVIAGQPRSLRSPT